MAAIVDAIRTKAALVLRAPSHLVHSVRHGDDHIRVDAADDVSIVLEPERGSCGPVPPGRGGWTVAEPFVGAMTLVPPVHSGVVRPRRDGERPYDATGMVGRPAHGPCRRSGTPIVSHCAHASPSTTRC